VRRREIVFSKTYNSDAILLQSAKPAFVTRYAPSSYGPMALIILDGASSETPFSTL
jgi:hypothetical protein